MVHLILLKRPINSFQPVRQRKQQSQYCPNIYTVISSVGADGQSGGFDSSNYTLNPISSSAKGRVRLDDLLTRTELFLRFWECHSPNLSTTLIAAMGCRQWLPLSVVQLKGKHCRKLHCRNGVVFRYIFGHNDKISLPAMVFIRFLVLKTESFD